MSEMKEGNSTIRIRDIGGRYGNSSGATSSKSDLPIPTSVNLNAETQTRLISVWGMLSGYVISPDMWKRDMDVYTIPERLVFDDPDDMEAWRLLNSTRSFKNIRRNMSNWYDFAFSGRNRRERLFCRWSTINPLDMFSASDTAKFDEIFRQWRDPQRGKGLMKAHGEALKSYLVETKQEDNALKSIGADSDALHYFLHAQVAPELGMMSRRVKVGFVQGRFGGVASLPELTKQNKPDLEAFLLTFFRTLYLPTKDLVDSREQVAEVKRFCDEARTDDMQSGPRKGKTIMIQYIPGILADALTRQKDVETVFRSQVNNMGGRYNALFSDNFAKLTREKVGGK